MYVLRQLTLLDSASFVEVGGASVTIRAFQIAVWVSLSMDAVLEENAPRFSAILDTGHNHNFSIQEWQVIEWARVRPNSLARLGEVRVNRQEVPLLAAFLWIHRNRSGRSELLPRPYRMALPQGIAMYPDGTPDAPRLPLLGLRGLLSNKLRLTIDGANRLVSLRS